MTRPVLLLNADYSPLGLCGVERAIVLVLMQKADLIHAREDAFVRSQRVAIPLPSVVRLRQYARVPYRKIMLTRKNVLRRDEHRCQYCGNREALTIDHVFPRSRGGKDTWENLVAACSRCNSRKGNRTPAEAEMPLRRPPFRPSHVMFIRDFVGHVEPAWKPYLFID